MLDKMLSYVVDLLIMARLAVFQTTLGTRVWNYLYDIYYSFLDFDTDKLPYTNYGYEVCVDPSNDCIDQHIDDCQPSLRVALPKQFQQQWRSVNLYAAVLSLPNIYKDRLKPIVGGKTVNTDNILDDKQFVEVGSGRGGGCLALHGCCKPQNYTGVDLSQKAVIRARRLIESCQTPALKNLDCIDFKVANSMMLDKVIAKNSVDVVFNVESSHCYPNLPDFFQSTNDILRPGGLFIWADLQYPGDIQTIKASMNKAGLKVRAVHDIAPNVSASLKNGVLDPIHEIYASKWDSLGIFSRCVYYLFWRLASHVAPRMLHTHRMCYHTILCQKVVDQDFTDLQRRICA